MDAQTGLDQRKVLSLYIDYDDESLYRIQDGSKVKYVVIEPGVSEYQDIMRIPRLLLQKLPTFPAGHWNVMRISKHGSTTSHAALPSVQSVWHSNKIEVLTLHSVKKLNSRVHEVRYEDKPAIAKIARFDFEMPLVETETIAYSMLKNLNIAPRFLGHLVEEGRVMGILLEKVDGRPAEPRDLKTCTHLARNVHQIGLLHGDLNKYNFLIGQEARLLDFENARYFNLDEAKEELEGLEAQLKEKSGRGGPEQRCG